MSCHNDRGGIWHCDCIILILKIKREPSGCLRLTVRGLVQKGCSSARGHVQIPLWRQLWPVVLSWLSPDYGNEKLWCSSVVKILLCADCVFTWQLLAISEYTWLKFCLIKKKKRNSLWSAYISLVGSVLNKQTGSVPGVLRAAGASLVKSAVAVLPLATFASGCADLLPASLIAHPCWMPSDEQPLPPGRALSGPCCSFSWRPPSLGGVWFTSVDLGTYVLAFDIM